MRYAGAYHCCRSSSSSPGLVSVTTSLRRYGTAEGSISHLSRHDIARQLGLQMRAVRRAPELLEASAAGYGGARPVFWALGPEPSAGDPARIVTPVGYNNARIGAQVPLGWSTSPKGVSCAVPNRLSARRQLTPGDTFVDDMIAELQLDERAHDATIVRTEGAARPRGACPPPGVAPE